MFIKGELKVKVCGITRPADAEAAMEAGADILGLILCKSKRQITLKTAKKIVDTVAGRIPVALVFQNQPPSAVNEATAALRHDFVQLHGYETPEYIKALDSRAQVLKGIEYAPGGRVDLESLQAFARQVDHILLDVSKGSATITHEERVQTLNALVAAHPLILERAFIAGRIQPLEIESLAKAFSPYGIDLCSSLEERPGIKSLEKLKQLKIAMTRIKETGGPATSQP